MAGGRTGSNQAVTALIRDNWCCQKLQMLQMFKKKCSERCMFCRQDGGSTLLAGNVRSTSFQNCGTFY